MDGQKVEEYALVGNTLFTLHKVVLPGQLNGEVEKEYCMSEFQGAPAALSKSTRPQLQLQWFVKPSSLLACNGMFVVMAYGIFPNHETV